MPLVAIIYLTVLGSVMSDSRTITLLVNVEFYPLGLRANTTCISKNIMGIKDKKYLAAIYGKKIVKATKNGYSIKFKMI